MDICVQTGTVVYEFGFEQGYKMIRDAGFTAVDWNIDNDLSRTTLEKATELKNLCIFEKPLDEVLAYYEPQLKEIRKNGLKISQAHAPFPAYLTGREDILDYTICVYCRIIELCDAVGCQNLIIHGITPSPGVTEAAEGPEQIHALNMKLYSSLIDTLKKTNVTVCLENLFRQAPMHNFYEGHRSDPHLAVEYIDTLNSMAGKECFGLCMDTGHLNLLGKRFYTSGPVLGKRIKALHIHDNAGKHDSHMAPYSGTILWHEFVEELRKIGYDHDLSFETFRQTKQATVGAELVPHFLAHIYTLGDYFRKKISE